MEVTGLIAERFVKYVTEDDLFSDEMVGTQLFSLLLYFIDSIHYTL